MERVRAYLDREEIARITSPEKIFKFMSNRDNELRRISESYRAQTLGMPGEYHAAFDAYATALIEYHAWYLLRDKCKRENACTLGDAAPPASNPLVLDPFLQKTMPDAEDRIESRKRSLILGNLSMSADFAFCNDGVGQAYKTVVDARSRLNDLRTSDPYLYDAYHRTIVSYTKIMRERKELMDLMGDVLKMVRGDLPLYAQGAGLQA